MKEQLDRYREALDNLVVTDYLDFRFFVNGQPTASIRIGEIRNGKVVPLPENFDQFTNLIKEFCSRAPQTIKSSKKLAEMMADKAKLLAFIIKNALESDEETHENSTLKEQMQAFKDILIHDIDAKAFADIYAQTIAYGMFAARLHDPTLESFSRQEAAERVPKTNPFLRKLFQYIAGYDLDDRIKWIVDALADIFRATDVKSLLANFGRSTQTHDPIMHFYETFLAEYDPKLRKSRGVFYKPEPVVDFIVRAVDDILKTEFNLPHGLADTSKTKIKVDVQGKLQEKEVHKVQILDPATGTGTFLAQVIKQIYKGFKNQQGIWNQYVDEHLIPRLNGFELLMAPYAMAHLKLDVLLGELAERKSSAFPHLDPASGGREAEPRGVENIGEGSGEAELRRSAMRQAVSERTKRFQIYLTNALEEHHPDTGTLFASWLSAEANEANHIKRDTPVMVVIGNPPYAVSSSNRSIGKDGKKTWIGELIDDYKTGLNEKKLNLDDDYIKFIRLGQYFVEKNGSGILAYISNNSFLGGITHRKMRQSLLSTFNQLLVINLHGNSKQKETAPDGSPDQNVFDITQGVSINILFRNRQVKENEIGKVNYLDLFGTRAKKYSTLVSEDRDSIGVVSIFPTEPNYFLLPKVESDIGKYEKGFYLKDLFLVHASGVKTDRDKLFVDFDSNALADRFKVLLSGKADFRFQEEFGVKDSGSYKITKKILRRHFSSDALKPVCYRPFDIRWIYYDPEIVSRPGRDSCLNMLRGANVGLLCGRQNKSANTSHYFLTNRISEMKTAEATIGSYHFPLYLYSPQNTLDGNPERTPNLNMEIVEKIAAGLGLEFVTEKGGNPSDSEGVPSQPNDTLPIGRVSALGGKSFAPIDLLDYIYAVLHSPTYREKYKEFWKIDFPRVPYPSDAGTFWQLVALGGELREIHLLESAKVNQFITGYPVGGTNEVVKPRFVQKPDRKEGLDQDVDSLALPNGQASSDRGRVFINDTQYFSEVPEVAWNFYIGGYQPAQKWLKDRKGRKLSFDDIQHYQKIIVALTETDRIMKEIDEIDFVEPE